MPQPCFLKHALFHLICAQKVLDRAWIFFNYFYDLSHGKRRICLNYRTLYKSPLSKYIPISYT